MYEATRERMEVQSPLPPTIDEDAVWTWIAGSRKRGRIYGMGVVPLPSHKYPYLFANPEDEDTASGLPDLRE
ncbi:hypothetical protein PIB30_091853 [Stylosanthes scabra]|uniref:Uncharacterized protein n=1 Tax=Stylosanthes scabra TaxID=79078 RepID=A0ABU6VWQ9_9FABA|nr:hypothetical protein [Stylosanthes scabra]